MFQENDVADAALAACVEDLLDGTYSWSCELFNYVLPPKRINFGSLTLSRRGRKHRRVRPIAGKVASLARHLLATSGVFDGAYSR